MTTVYPEDVTNFKLYNHVAGKDVDLLVAKAVIETESQFKLASAPVYETKEEKSKAKHDMAMQIIIDGLILIYDTTIEEYLPDWVDNIARETIIPLLPFWISGLVKDYTDKGMF